MGFAIMRSNSARKGAEVVTPEVFPLDVHCVNSTSLSALHTFSHWRDIRIALPFQRKLQWNIKRFRISVPIYRKESRNKNKQNIVLSITDFVLLTLYFPTSPYFSSLKNFLCWEIRWEGVYFPLSPTLFKIEPTSVRLIPLVFETVSVTGYLYTVWQGLTSLVYLHNTDVFAHVWTYSKTCVIPWFIHILNSYRTVCIFF